MQIESQKQRNIFLVQASNALSTIYKLKQCNCRKYEVLWFCELIGWGVEAVKVEFHPNGVSTTCSGLSYGFPWWLPLKKMLLFISRIYLMLTCRICHNLVQWTFFLQCFFISLKTSALLLCRCTLLLCQGHTVFFSFFFHYFSVWYVCYFFTELTQQEVSGNSVDVFNPFRNSEVQKLFSDKQYNVAINSNSQFYERDMFVHIGSFFANNIYLFVHKLHKWSTVNKKTE